MATAPGFAHYLTFLAPLRDSDGFWTGVVEALVPAFVLSHLLMAAVLATHRASILSILIELINRYVEEDTLYFGESTTSSRIQSYFLVISEPTRCNLTRNLRELFVATILPLTIAALEFAAQGLAEDLQPARSVGDGAAFYSESSTSSTSSPY